MRGLGQRVRQVHSRPFLPSPAYSARTLHLASSAPSRFPFLARNGSHMETKVYMSTYRDAGVAPPPCSFPPPPTNTTTATATAAPLLTVTSNSGSSGGSSGGSGGGLMGALDVVMAALRGQKQAPRACEQGLRLLVLACEGEVPLPFPVPSSVAFLSSFPQ